jgi:outer membrane protein TolC
MKKAHFFLIILLILILFNPIPSFSQDMPKGKAALSELIEEALSQNPQIKAARNQWEASIKVIPQAKSLPDPMLGYAYFGQSVETRLGPQRNKFSLSQKFPFFGKLSLKGEIAKSAASLFEEQYNVVKADIVLGVKKAYFSLFWFDNALRITNEEKEVLRRLAKIAQKKYETGKGNQQDVLKAHLEISRVTDKILLLKQGRKGITAGLNSLLNRSPDSFLGEIEEFKAPELKAELKDLYAWAKEFRPELRKARYLIEKNEKSLKLAKKNDGRNSWMASIGINIPIWRGKLRASEAEAAIKIEASQEGYKNIENKTLSSVNELFFEVKTASQEVDLYKYSLIPQAEQSLKASEVGYLAGKVDFLNLLDSERMLLQIKTGYFKAVADLGKSLAQLERVVGKNLVGV